MVMIREGMRGGSASTSSASKAAKAGRLVGRGGAAVGRDPESEELEYQEKMRAYTRAMISEANDNNAAEHYRRQFLSVFFQKPLLSNEEADFQPNLVVSSPEEARQPPTCWNVHQEGNAAGGAVDRFLVEKHAPVREKIRTIVNAEREREIEERVKAIPAVNGSKNIMQSCTLRSIRGLEANRRPAASMLPPQRGVTPSLEWMACTYPASLHHRVPDQVMTDVCTDWGLTRSHLEARIKRCQKSMWSNMLQDVREFAY